ncbi:MAG: ATP synthase F1 subunit gamma [Flavobacteriales bacterium]
MANLKELRTRIGSIKSTMQITSAMKMVSAAKLKRAQDAITQMRPYADKLKELLENLSASIEQDESGGFSELRDVKKVLLVNIASNRGLCGGFNMNVVKRVNKLKATTYKDVQVDLLTIGKKMTDFGSRSDYQVFGSEIKIFDGLNFDKSSEIAEKVMTAFLEGEYDRVELVYNHFINAATQEVLVEQFLPVQTIETEENTSQTEYAFEPSQEVIVKDLIPKSLKIQFYKALLDSHASEHGARMTSMHQATDNAADLNADLTLQYNRQRQAAITNEILEIVGGAEALA